MVCNGILLEKVHYGLLPKLLHLHFFFCRDFAITSRFFLIIVSSYFQYVNSCSNTFIERDIFISLSFWWIQNFFSKDVNTSKPWFLVVDYDVVICYFQLSSRAFNFETFFINQSAMFTIKTWFIGNFFVHCHLLNESV